MLLSQLPELMADPLLGLSIAFRADQNPNKVDLGVGIYKDANGATPIMAAVAQAQTLWLQQESTKAYTAPGGFDGFNEGMLSLLLGDHSALRDARAVSVQTPGGCGAVRVAAEMLMRCQKQVNIWVSTPTWANHIPLLSSAGLNLVEYPYYDYAAHTIDFAAMLTALDALQAGDVVLLHGCCHNPSGADLTFDQWQTLATLINEKGAIPFVDIAYQGFGSSIDDDVKGLRYLAEHCQELVIASSCSKNFGLYRERVGAVAVVAKNAATANICRNQLMNVAREIYSMPPSHGAALVDIILHSADLRQSWQDELAQMRERIVQLRTSFALSLNQAGFGTDFDFIETEKGMFSFLGITAQQVQQLRDQYSIYMAGSSRINVAGLNENNIAYVVDALKRIT